MRGRVALSFASIRRRKSSPFAKALAPLAKAEGFVPTHLPGVRLMHSRISRPRGPVSYDASIVLIAQGRKIGHLGTRTFTYDPRHYLVLSIPLPFECETVGSTEEPMLGLAIQVDPATVTELLLELDHVPPQALPLRPQPRRGLRAG